MPPNLLLVPSLYKIDHVLYYITLSTIFIAALSGLVSFKLDYPIHLKLVACLLVFTFLCECYAWALTRIFRESNLTLYNIVMGVEFFVYAIYFRLVLQNKRLKTVLKWYLWLLPVFWCVVTFRVFGLGSWDSYLAVTGSLATVILAAAFYYELFTAANLVKLGTSPEFWIATALIIYYSGSLPFTGMMHLLNKQFPELSREFTKIFQILNMLLYLLLSYAFLCRIPTRRSS